MQNRTDLTVPFVLDVPLLQFPAIYRPVQLPDERELPRYGVSFSKHLLPDEVAAILPANKNFLARAISNQPPRITLNHPAGEASYTMLAARKNIAEVRNMNPDLMFRDVPATLALRVYEHRSIYYPKGKPTLILEGIALDVLKINDPLKM